MTAPAPGRIIDRRSGGEPVDALAERITALVAGTPGVAGLVAGPIATYLAGRTIPGVAIRDREIEVAVAVRYGTALYPLAERIRAVVRGLAPGHRVDVFIEDVLPGPLR